MDSCLMSSRHGFGSRFLLVTTSVASFFKDLANIFPQAKILMVHLESIYDQIVF